MSNLPQGYTPALAEDEYEEQCCEGCGQLPEDCDCGVDDAVSSHLDDCARDGRDPE